MFAVALTSEPVIVSPNLKPLEHAPFRPTIYSIKNSMDQQCFNELIESINIQKNEITL